MDPHRPRRARLAPLARAALAALLAQTFAGVPPLLAADPSAVTSVTRLGGRNAFCKPPLRSTADLQKLFVSMRADILTVLAKAGFEGESDTLFEDVAAGRVRELQIQPGQTLNWMSIRRRGKPDVLHNIRWDGKTPIDAYGIRLATADADYTFVIPRACGNFALMERVDVAPPACAISVKPGSDCVTRTITLDATGSSVGRGKLTVTATVAGPDGKSQDVGAPDVAGGLKWTKSYRTPGTYTFSVVTVAENGRKSEVCTAKADIRACPPSCAFTLSASELYTGEEFTIDASGSKPEIGTLKTVHVEVVSAGRPATTMELQAPFKTTMKLDKAGVYTFRAVAEDDLGQRSTGTCEATIEILPRIALVADFFGGKERRVRPEFLGGRCAPLLGVKLGPSYLVNRNFEIAALLGGVTNTRDRKNYSLLADLEANYVGRRGFFGAGVGIWDFTHDETRSGDVLVHAGVNLGTRRRPPALFIEGRVPFDSFDDIDNNYMIFAGLRVHFPN